MDAKLAIEARIKELMRERDAIDEKIDSLQTIRDALDDKETYKELTRAFSATSENGSGPPERPKSVQLEQVWRYFVSKKNEWAGAPEIAEVTGLESHTIRQLVYARYKDFFERRNNPENEKRKEFRLVQEQLPKKLTGN